MISKQYITLESGINIGGTLINVWIIFQGLWPYRSRLIWANIVRPSDDRRSNDTAFGTGTFSGQDPLHSWKAGLDEAMTAEILFIQTGTRGIILVWTSWSTKS